MLLLWIGISCATKETQEPTSCVQEVWYQDQDQDGFGDPFVSMESCVQETGYVSNNQDCDDESAQAYPNAIWYRDADTDGFGSADHTLQTCIPPLGYVTNADDCDDLDATKSPELFWYHDGDGDGFGGTESVPSCDSTSDSVSNNLDCNDDDFFIHPDGIEVCDAIDNNCNGDIDDEDALLDTFTTIPHFVDEDGDGYGTSELLGYFCPSYTMGSLIAGDCDDSNMAIHPRAIELNDDIDSDCDGNAFTMNANRFTQGWESPVGGGFGILADAKDIGEDSSHPAMLFSMHGYDGSRGGLYYLPANTPPDGLTDISSSAIFWSGQTELERVGRSLVFAGDLNGDGVEDILAGGDFDENPRNGALYLLSVDMEEGTIPESPLLTGTEGSYFSNDLLAIGDANEDGFDDVLITARSDDTSGSNRGAVHILSGGLEPSISHSIYGNSNGQQIGFQISSIEDFDGDGIIEYAISSLYTDVLANNAGSVYLLPKSMLFDEAIDFDTLLQFHGTQNNEHVGYSVVDAGDFNGDGQHDLLIGSPDYDQIESDEGRAFLVHGGSTNPDLSQADYIFYGAWDDDNTGEFVHRLGDINGDDLSDIAIIAHKNDNNGNNSGAVYGMFGGAETGSFMLADDASFIVYGATSNDQLGRGILPVGDVDEDGYDDFWLTSSAHVYGKAYLMYGSE